MVRLGDGRSRLCAAGGEGAAAAPAATDTMQESALQMAARIMMEQQSRHAIAQERLQEQHARDLKELLLTGLRCGAADSAAGATIDNVKARIPKSVSEQAQDAEEGLGALQARLFNLVSEAEPADQEMNEFEEWRPPQDDGALESSFGGAATEPEAEEVFANNPIREPGYSECRGGC